MSHCRDQPGQTKGNTHTHSLLFTMYILISPGRLSARTIGATNGRYQRDQELKMKCPIFIIAIGGRWIQLACFQWKLIVYLAWDKIFIHQSIEEHLILDSNRRQSVPISPSLPLSLSSFLLLPPSLSLPPPHLIFVTAKNQTNSMPRRNVIAPAATTQPSHLLAFRRIGNSSDRQWRA